MFYNALIKKYEAEIEECLATLQVYMNKSVGIGEHSDLLTELDKYVSRLAAAEDNLATLQGHKGTLTGSANVTKSETGLDTHTLNG
jgi:hypothetical protein